MRRPTPKDASITTGSFRHGWPAPADCAPSVAHLRADAAGRPSFGLVHTDALPPAQEPEAEFLERHGLMGRAEKAALAAGEGEPVYGGNGPSLWQARLAEVYGGEGE